MKTRTLFIGLLLHSLTNTSLAQEKTNAATTLDSLREMTHTSYHDSIRANAYIKISLELYLSHFDTLLTLNQKAEEIARSNLSKEDLLPEERGTFRRLLSEANSNIGYYYQETGDYREAFRRYDFSLKIDRQMNNLYGISSAVNNLGMIFNYLGDTRRALDFFLLGLKIDEYRGDLEGLGPSYNNVAYIYEHQGDTTEAKKYYEKALQSFQSTENKTSEALVLINLAHVNHSADPTESFRMYRKALNISSQLNFSSGKASALLGIGHLYFVSDELDSAKFYLSRSLQLYAKMNNKSGVSISKINLGKIAFRQGNHLTAITLAKEGLKLAEETNEMRNKHLAHLLLSEALEAIGKHRESLHHYKKHIELKDSIQNIETEKSVFEKRVSYEYEKEKALDELAHKKELTLKEEKERSQNITIIALVSVAFIIIVFLVLFIRRFRLTLHQKRIIEAKNKENELLLGEIHHRVKNNLQVVSSLLNLQQKNIEDNSAKKAIVESNERVKSMGLIHKMLYQHDNFSGIEMTEYIHELTYGLLNTFGIDRSEFELKLNAEKIRLDVDTAVPIGLIINELIVNTFKYAFDKAKALELSISLVRKHDQLVLKVSDNGSGKVSEVENSTSFGSKLIRSLVRQLNGQLQLNDEHGLSYTINFKDYKLV